MSDDLADVAAPGAKTSHRAGVSEGHSLTDTGTRTGPPATSSAGAPRRSHPLRLPERQALIAIGDFTAGFAGTVLASVLWELITGRAIGVGKLATLFVAATWVLSLLLVHGYASVVPLSRLYSGASTAKASVIVAAAGFLAFSIFPYRMSRPTAVLAAVAGACFVTLWRVTLARLLLRDAFATPTIVVSAAPATSDVREALALARNEYDILESITPPDCLSRDTALDRLSTALREIQPKEVLVGPLPNSVAAAVVEQCVTAGVNVRHLGSTLEAYLARVPLDYVDHQWFLHLPSGRLRDRPSLIMRRCFDLLVVILISLPLFLLTPIVGALILLTSPGPMYYRQRRLGRYGAEFEMLKFRTMRPDAELEGPRWAAAADSRTTAIGRLLRATHFDELPQIINIWRGEMSLTGPRPERPEFVEVLAERIPHYRARLLVKPGITGWGQVKNGYASSIPDHQRYLEYDLYYIKHRSIRLDLQIIILTVFTVLGLRGR